MNLPDTSSIPATLTRIFVVDDDLATRQALDSMLRSVGYEVVLFESGAGLLEHVKKEAACCIVLDVRLPGTSGLEIQRRLIAMGIQTPLVFITGHGDIAMAVRAMKAHAVEFLTKPFRDQDLLDAISSAVEIDAARRQTSERRARALQQIEVLSAREREIFMLVSRGLLGKQIAHELNLSEATIKVHRRNIMQKLGLANVSQLVQLWGFLAGGIGEAQVASPSDFG